MPDSRQWHFYVIALAPDLHPHRVKFGISVDPLQRFAQHTTAAPTAKLLYRTEIPNPARVYEHRCILAGRGENFTRIGPEVYDVDDAEAAVDRVECFLGEKQIAEDEESRDSFLYWGEETVRFAELMWNMRRGNDAGFVADVRDRMLEILLVRWALPNEEAP